MLIKRDRFLSLRRRLRLEGQGIGSGSGSSGPGAVGRLWGEVARAVVDTVRMAGRGLV